jgi:hypothetical protein
MSLATSIAEAYRLKREKKWEKLYFAIDLHGTIIEPGRLIKLNVYPEAKMGLKFLSNFSDIVLILYTSTIPEMLKEFYEWCANNNIKFAYLNDNPECSEKNHDGDYTKKFYYNVMLDDRAGFNYKEDWHVVVDSINRQIP